jgi:hypothetical protein
MHDRRMPTKTISLELDAYEWLKRAKKNEGESFSQVVRRLAQERPVMTAGELEEAMAPFIGQGAGTKRAQRAAA